MKPFFLTYFFLCLFTAQATEWYPLGARSSAMANASVASSNLWSIKHNQAGLAFVEQISFGLAAENRFGLQELSLGGGVVALPSKVGVFGMSLTHFGDELFSESQVGFAYARTFGKSVSAGVQLNYRNTHLGNQYGNKNTLLLEGGLQAKLNKEITFGVHIANPNRSSLSEDYDERYPTTFRMGMQYEVSDKVLLVAEGEKTTQQELAAKIGLEYQVLEQLYLRTGISTNPMQNSFGIGVCWSQFKLDLSTWRHGTLGYIPQLSITYEIGK